MATNKSANLHEKPTVSVPEAARHLPVSPDHVRKLIQRGELKASKLGTRVIIQSQHLANLLDNNRI